LGRRRDIARFGDDGDEEHDGRVFRATVCHELFFSATIGIFSRPTNGRRRRRRRHSRWLLKIFGGDRTEKV
jgi:hypothetical protein